MNHFFNSFILFFLSIHFFNISAQYPAWQNIVYTEHVLSIADQGNFRWIGTEYAGLIEENLSTGEKKLYNKVNTPLRSSTIRATAIDNNGHKWLGTSTGGLYKYDGQSWQEIKINNQPFNFSISDIEVDALGNIWVASGGVHKYNSTSWTTYNTSNSGLPSDIVYSIEMDKNGVLWAASGNRIASFNGSTWQNFTGANVGLGFTKVNSIHVENRIISGLEHLQV